NSYAQFVGRDGAPSAPKIARTRARARPERGPTPETASQPSAADALSVELVPDRQVGGVSAPSYQPLIREIAARHAVPAKLVEAVIHVESGFDPRAVSHRGAQGLMQLMPATAEQLGVRDVFDPRQNIEGGVLHLRRLLERYGDFRLALAAYNAGEKA